MNAIPDNSQNQVFIENLKKMSDEQVLTAIKNSADYDPYFIGLAKEEIALRGYDPSDSDLQDIDSTVIKHKTTDELVDIYVNSSDYKKEWESLAEKELKARDFDIDSLYAEKKNGEKMLKDGVAGSYIILGYILAIFGGLVGIVMALNYKYRKQELANGDKLPYYDADTRRHANIMLILWGIINILAIIAIVA